MYRTKNYKLAFKTYKSSLPALLLAQERDQVGRASEIERKQKEDLSECRIGNPIPERHAIYQ